MKKLLKLIITSCMLVTCFGVNVFAEIENITFAGDNNEINEVIDYNNVIIESGATVYITGIGAMVVHGSFVCNGTIAAADGAHIVFDDVSQAIEKIDVYDHWGNNFEENPSGFMEFEYVGDKWMQFFPSTTFKSDNNGTDENKIDDFVEYDNVTIESGAIVVINGVLAIHGDFTNNGTLNPSDGAHIIFDDVTKAIGKIDIYDSEGNEFEESPSGFMEFEFNDNKWKEFVPRTELTYAVSYDVNAGEVWHYEGDSFVKIVPSSEPYTYNVVGEDKLYILEYPGWVYDHIEAEGDEPEYPENSIINKEDLSDEEIESTNYKVVKITPNPKDDNFYFFQFVFIEDLETKFVEELKTLDLALDKNATEDDLKGYIGGVIHSTYIDAGSRKHLSTIFDGYSLEDFKEKIIIVNDGAPTNTPISIDGEEQTDYFKYSLTGVNGFVGIVYKIDGKDKFILRDGDTYTTIDVGKEGKTVTELKDFGAVDVSKVVTREVTNTLYSANKAVDNSYEIFGNYACFPMNETGLMQDGQDTSHISIESVMASNDDYSSLNCVLILYTNDFVGISIKSDEKAIPWDKDNLPFYALNSGEEEASVFYMSKSIEITKPYGSPENSEIVDVNFENGSKTWKDCKIPKDTNEVEFGSIFYDRVPILVKFSNGVEKKITIVRTGLMPGDYPAPGGSDSVEVFGTEVKFEGEKRWLIATQFYYDTEEMPTERVQLFVTITYNDGSIERKLVEKPINENVINDDSDNKYKYFDVFELWRGKFDARPVKIESIVFDAGDGDTFGGVKLGSGKGSRWLRERSRQ